MKQLFLNIIAINFNQKSNFFPIHITSNRYITSSSSKSIRKKAKMSNNNETTNSSKQRASRVGIVWFRNDLRTNDNSTLNKAIDLINKKRFDLILPFYCYDKEMLDGVSRIAKLPRCGEFRRNFLIESVENLKENLVNRLDSNLYISYGDPATELIKLIEKVQSTSNIIDSVIASKEVPSEEVELEEKLSKYCKEKNIIFSLVWDATMIHFDDLPYDNISKMPDTFTHFRKDCEHRGDYRVRNYIPIKENYKLPTFKDLTDFGHENTPKKAKILSSNELDKSAIANMKGGESEAISRTINYFFKSEGLQNYKSTRNGLIGTEYSSKLSLWLANGCISPRFLYWKVKDYENQHKANESTKHFVFELLWRDFFKFHSLKIGKRLFYLHGCFSSSARPLTASRRYQDYEWKKDKVKFEKWCKGETGYPFVDANMRELNATGWMSNRGRQNVASFLAKDMEIDWRLGAEYFETMLIDYDVTSNWGNWQYASGVGSDPRDRIFNVIKQGYDYDENGDYVRMWVPEVAKVPLKFVHCPFMMGMNDQKRLNCLIGTDYFEPIVKAKTSWNPSEPRKPNKFAINAKNSRNK